MQKPRAAGRRIAVLDIGKSNLKAALIDGDTLEELGGLCAPRGGWRLGRPLSARRHGGDLGVPPGGRPRGVRRAGPGGCDRAHRAWRDRRPGGP